MTFEDLLAVFPGNRCLTAFAGKIHRAKRRQYSGNGLWICPRPVRSKRLAFLLKFDKSEFGGASSFKRGKKVKPSSEETNYEKIPAAREKEKCGLIVEKSASGELATAEPEPEESTERNTFEQILTADESEETTAELAPEEESQSATLPEIDLPAENVIPENKRNETAPKQSSGMAPRSRLTFAAPIRSLRSLSAARNASPLPAKE